MSKNRQLTINLIASVLSFLINLGISFFLTTYVTKNIGIEAYGFVSLGTNFINYVSLITIALNSMASRFITIEIHKDNWDSANKYFNSVLMGNIIVASTLLIPITFLILKLESLINIPSNLISDVKFLLAFLFVNYLISIVTSTFEVATFVTNKLHLKSLREIEGRILKVLTLVLLFSILKPAVSYVGVSSLVMIIYTSFFYIYYTNKLLPNIKISKIYFEFKLVIELVSAGIWNTIIQVGQILLQGVDLLIANIFLGATAMGTLAVSKTIPIAILSLVSVVSTVFLPDFTKYYAKEDTIGLINAIKKSMKILGIIISIPVAFLFSFGESFFSLWVPTENPVTLQILSIIAIISIVISGPINGIYGIFTVINRIRANALIVLITGFLNLGIVFIVLNTTNFGIYAIAGISTILSIIMNLIFTAPYGASYLGLKKSAFFPEILKSILGFLSVSIIGVLINSFIDINTWIELFICGVIMTVIGIPFNALIFFKREELISIYNMIKNRMRRK